MDEENELIALRRKKLDALRAKGVDPFGGGFEVTGSIAEVREKFKEGETFRIAGRITAHAMRSGPWRCEIVALSKEWPFSGSSGADARPRRGDAN